MASNRINDGFVYNGDAGAALDALGVGAPSTDMDGNEVLRWAVSQPSLTASDDEYRARATVIGRHLTGRVDPFGRVFSGNRQEGLGAREYYDKMIGFVQTMDPDTLWTDEAREYRALKTDAERTEYAKKHWDKKWRDYGDDVYDAVVPTTDPLQARDIERLGEFMSDEDRAFMNEWYSGSDPETLRQYNTQGSAEAMASVPQDPATSNVGQMLLPQEQRRSFDADFLDRMRKAVEIKKRYEPTLRDIGIREKFEQKMADENQWATYMRLKDGFTPEEARCIDLALAAGGKDGLANPAREAFMALSTDSQRKVAPLLKMNAWRRDTTLVGDAVRGFARVLGETVQDAASGAAHYVERLCVNGAEYQENAERRALLRMAEEGRMKEWGLAGEAVVGAFSTIPYMAIASMPYVGTATMILSAGEQFEREAALSGGDVSSWGMQIAKAGMSVAYALVERLQAHNVFGEVSDFERRKLYADFFHHINRNLAGKLAGGIAVDTFHESFEEGLQNGIQEAFVALSVDGDMARAFTRGFVEDAVGTLGTMFITSLVGGARHTEQYRNRPFTAEEVVSWTAELEAAARSTEGSQSGNEGLAEIGKALGFVSRDWRRAAGAAAEAGAGAAELRKAALMKYGLTEGQAVEWDAMLTQIERNIGEDKTAVQAFYGTSRALTRSEIRQAGGMVETVDEKTGARTLTFNDMFGTGTFSVELNAASGVDAEYAKTDEGVRSIVNALNDSRQPAPDGGAWTDENWRALPDADKQSILSEFRNPGLTTFRIATGETVDNRFLAALEGKMQIADNAESGDVLGVAAFHEQGHVAGKMLALAARNGDEKARELVGKLAEKFGTAKLGSEEFDEEVFGDRFRDYLVGRFDVQDGWLVRKSGALDVAAEDETLFGKFVDWVRSLFSQADEAVRTRTRYDEFFEQAVSGDLEGAVAADEAAGGEGGPVQDLHETDDSLRSVQEKGGETAESVQESVENPRFTQNEVFDKALEKAERQVADYEARLAALPESATAKRRELEKKLAKARRVLERAGGAGARASIRAGSRVTPAEDAAYMDAVRRGDMETAQRMVREAAKKAGFLLRGFHGTKAYGFTEFISGNSPGIFFAKSQSIARSYVTKSSGGIYNAYLKMNNTRVIDCDGSWSDSVFDLSKLPPGGTAYEHISVRFAPVGILIYAGKLGEYYSSPNAPYARNVYSSQNINDVVDFIRKKLGEEIAGRFEKARRERPEGMSYDLVYRNEVVYTDADVRESFFGEKLKDATTTRIVEGKTTDEIAEESFDAGFDSVIFKNIRDRGPNAKGANRFRKSDVYVVKNSNQAKSADPVTYDDAGNVIPLSQRFNPEMEDIRYSIRGPSMSKMDAAVAFAARDAMTGRSREDADYQRLIDALGIGKMYTPQELRKAGEAVAAAARMKGEGEPETRSWRMRMKATGNRDVNRVADTATEQARRLASHPSDMETEAVREGIRRNPTLRELAKLAEAGRRVDDAIKAAYSLGERAGVDIATEAQKAEDEMKRAEEKLRQAERDAAKDEKQRDRIADLRADYQEKLRAYREKVAAKEAGEKAMRQMLATQMRLHANAENVQDLDRVLGVPAVELMAQISEVLFSGAKAPGQVREKAASGEATAEGATAGDGTAPDADAASPAGPEVRVVGTVEEASQAEAEELHDKLVRVQAIMRDFREKQKAKAEEQARKRAEREEREEAEAKPVGNDEMEAEADEGEEDSGETKEDSEPEVIETVDAAADPEMVRAMLNALKTESLDLNTSKDFATYVLAFVMDSVQQSLNMEFDAVFRNTDPIVKVKFRKTLIDFLRATSDALLDPTDDAAAKLVERQIGDIKDDASVAQLWRAAAGILGVIQRRGIQQSRRRIMRDIDKYLKRMAGSGRKLDPLAPDLSRRMTARAVQDARWLRRVLKLSNGGVIAEQNKLQHTIEERQTEGGDATDVQIDRAMRRMRLLEQFGGLRYMMPAEIKVAQHYIEDRFNAEAMELARQVEERKARTGAVADALIAAADATREALGGFDAEDGKGLGARGRRLLDSLAGGSLRQRLQHLTGDDPAARRAVDEIVRMVFEGETQHRLLEQRFKREHDAILQFAAEAGGIDQRTLLRQLDENVPDELSRALATPEQNRRLKWGQALQLLVSLEQMASYGDNIALHFRGDKDANGNPQTPHSKLILDAMADKPQFQALINKLRETYRDRRGMISEVMERVTGLPVLSPDPLFMPVRMKSAPREGLDMKVKSWTPWNAIFSPRVKNNLDFDTSADIMGVFDERSRETAKSVAFAETGLDLRSILGRKETQTAFIRARGAFFNTRLIEQVTDALNSGYTTPSNDLINILRPLGTACTYASLSWNVVTMLKQMTSIPAWTAVLDGGYGELFRAMSSIDGESIREFMDAPGFRSRYGVEKGGWGTFAKIIGDAFRDPSRSYIQRFYDAGMTLVQFGDFVPSFLIGPGVYKARKAALMRQNPGMTEEAAKAQALSDAWSLVEQCQQSDLQENLPDILRRQGVVAKQVMKFCNSPLMQVAHEVQSARMWADAARRAKAGEAGAQETADKWRARFVNQIVCNHIIMPAAMYAAELLVKAALGNEPPDKDEVMGRIVAQMLLGSWGKVFILGVILDKVTTGASVGAGKATGLYNYKPTAYMSSGGSPAGIQLVEQFVSDMGRLGSDIAYTDWESLRDDSVRMLARSARPVKYGTDAAYNYGGADRAKERAARRRKVRKEREKAAGE